MSDPSPLYRCSTCKPKGASMNVRNLTVFIDGTSNKPGPESTNVFKLFSQLKTLREDETPEPEQPQLYLTGVGAFESDPDSRLLSRVGKEIYSYLEMAFAWNVEINVKNAYGWLAENYRKGDRIYLFGFSRGAYQVRALAAIIHEVGLVNVTKQEEIRQADDSTETKQEQNEQANHLEKKQEEIEQAYRHYCSIDPSDPQTRNAAIQFKKNSCWPGVRTHFVGVWDTVSSLGLIKQDVHITASASVTNACHFRHALALDERRVKFLPEYFLEMNPHPLSIEGPRLRVSDVKEVWFAGHHSDVGGTSRQHIEDDYLYGPHAGNVSFLWMKREAVANGLVFKPVEFPWVPKDVDYGRKEEMGFLWGFVETLPIRHQVAFGGTGKHARRLHMFRPRSVIPRQYIDSSILSGDVYVPRATLRDGVAIPTVPRAISGELWETEPLGESTTMSSLAPLDPQEALRLLEKVWFRLGFCNGQTITRTQLTEETIGKKSDFTRFVLSVMYDIDSNFSTSEGLAREARDSLITILASPNQAYFPETLEVLRISTKNGALRRRFVAYKEVVEALFHALERMTKRQREGLFPLVMDILCYLIDDNDQRDNVINQLNARSDVTKTDQTRLSLVLETKVPSHLMASLRMITTLARYHPVLCKGLKPRIIELAKGATGPVGVAAVRALVALNGILTRNIRFSNVLGFLDDTLPRLDVEVGRTSSPDVRVPLPPIFQLNGSGGLNNKDMVMHKLVRTIELGDAHQHTVAVLTFLKLCKYPAIRDFCPWEKVLDIFMKQMERTESSLLTVYALKMCLEYDWWTFDDSNFRRAAKLIVAMFKKGWFDDAVGQVEGSEILRDLMTFDKLKKEVIEVGVLSAIIKKFEGGERHAIRMGSIFLDVLAGECEEESEESENQVAQELELFVAESSAYLLDKKKKTQMKGVKILSALAQTVAGEKVIKPHVISIVRMLLPHAGHSTVPRSQLFGPTAVLRNLCRNETLRRDIQESPEYQKFTTLYNNSTLYPKTPSTQSKSE